MSLNNIVIREITQAANTQIASVIRSVFVELNAPKVGTAYQDMALDVMAETYNKPRMAYFVIYNGSKLLGGCGIAPLEGENNLVCELQKMYFLPEARGLGLGTKIMEACLNTARNFGYKFCYLETLPFMVAAQNRYEKFGFKFLKAPMGTTGHYACNVWMLKDL